MRRFICLSMLASLAIGNAGCLINAYSSEPNERVNQLINQSEDLRQLRQEWERFWFLDQPSHMSPERTDGGVQ